MLREWRKESEVPRRSRRALPPLPMRFPMVCGRGLCLVDSRPAAESDSATMIQVTELMDGKKLNDRGPKPRGRAERGRRRSSECGSPRVPCWLIHLPRVRTAEDVCQVAIGRRPCDRRDWARAPARLSRREGHSLSALNSPARRRSGPNGFLDVHQAQFETLALSDRH
jgi:hypothetical protein